MTRTVLLGDIADINNESVGKNYTFKDILYLDTSSVTENNYSELQPFMLADAPSRAKRIIRDGDIVYSTVRPNLKHFGYITNPAENTVASTGFAVIRAKEGISSKYLYYWLTSDERTAYLNSIADSQTSTFPAFNPSVLKKLEIELPEIEDQRKIADILGTIDEKIELNRKMNENLEKMGQTLFKKYFISNPATKNWKPGNIGDFARVKSGFAFKGSSFAESGDHPVIKIKNISNLGVDLENVTYISNDVLNDRMDEYVAVSGDILIAMSGNTTGKIGLMPRTNKKYYLNQRVGKYYLKSPLYSGFLYFFLKSKINQDYIIQSAYGSAQPNIGPNQLEGQRILIPDNKMLDSVGLLFQSIVNKIALNLSEDKDLITLRDSLLSRLISGRIKV